jgi:hypothetical protein
MTGTIDFQRPVEALQCAADGVDEARLGGPTP